jgi:alkanesulfonate monooxygenase SsuD/methylene tetrahydromethanopterin reductase-like flavin-dependent oxidoreductase (luciferase family)
MRASVSVSRVNLKPASGRAGTLSCYQASAWFSAYDYQIEIIELLEELGFDGVWVAEHHFREYGVVPSIFNLLSHLAARTERLRLGSGIVVLPLHNPIHVAEEAAMV